MISLGSDEQGDETEHSLEITIKLHQLKPGAAPAQRSAEENATVRRERNEAKHARMRDLEKLFENMQSSAGTGSSETLSGTIDASTSWRVHYPLHAAAEAGDMVQVDRLIDSSRTSDEKLLDSVDGLERSPMHYAASHGRLEVVDTLLNKGARIDLADVCHHTPLHKAAAAGHISVIRTLALALADTNARALGGVTPLMLACKGGHLECVEVLVRHGARREETDEDGLTAASYAPHHAPALQSLLSTNVHSRGELRVHVDDAALASSHHDEQFNTVKHDLARRVRSMLSALEGLDLSLPQSLPQGRVSSVPLSRHLGVHVSLSRCAFLHF